METTEIRERVKTTVFLPGDLHLRLKLQAVQQRTSMAELFVSALEQFLADREPAASKTSAGVSTPEVR